MRALYHSTEPPCRSWEASSINPNDQKKRIKEGSNICHNRLDPTADGGDRRGRSRNNLGPFEELLANSCKTKSGSIFSVSEQVDRGILAFDVHRIRRSSQRSEATTWWLAVKPSVSGDGRVKGSCSWSTSFSVLGAMAFDNFTAFEKMNINAEPLERVHFS
ncbi:uncharacterized protein LOC120163037 [Hibiscus syriacus]|uniref:uncharacterized protein LOC120163037 n=1 Tax=Hibiscus syriacus TaxID=106335 RepID=UPI00192489B7|nr:uncharacterized protein LOC120163037 [Hibiscus syriacus]